MTDGRMELDHDAAVRAAAGLSDVGVTVDDAAQALSIAAAALSWGQDAVGAALAARHDGTRQVVAAALPTVADSLRRLDSTVQAGASALAGTDEHTSSAVRRASERTV
jgi:hypothetical protein